MVKFQTSAWSKEKLASCGEDLNTLFFEAVGKGEKRMNPHAVDILNKDRVEIAETIVKLITETVTSINPLPFLVDEVVGDIRNDYTWQEMDTSLRVVSRSYGSKPLSQRLSFTEFSMSTTMKEVNVEIPLEEVFSGRQTPAMAATEMAVAIVRYRVANVLDALDAAIPAATADRTGVSGYTLRYVEGSVLTQGNLDKAIDGLEDESEGVSIFGRHISLFPAIRGFTNYSDPILGELTTRGVIGMYHGATIVTLKDPYAKRSADHLINKNRIYIAGSRKGAVYMTKPVDFLNYAFVDAKNAVFGTGLRIEDGLLVHDPYNYRIIELTL